MANEKRTLAFEIGSEEIPAFDLKSAISQLQKMVPAAFKEAGIPFDDVKIYDSPRRLIVMASGVAEEIPAQHEEYKGPKVSIASTTRATTPRPPLASLAVRALR